MRIQPVGWPGNTAIGTPTRPALQIGEGGLFRATGGGIGITQEFTGATNAILVNSAGVSTSSSLCYGWANTAVFTSTGGANGIGSDICRFAIGIMRAGQGNGSTTVDGFFLDAGTERVVSDLANATTTFGNMTGISVPLLAGQKFVGELVVKCNNSTAAEGIKFDFNGGTATVTSFWAAGNQLVGGTDVLGTGISTSLPGVINFTTITGETLIVIKFSLVTNAAGTFIPRFAENSSAAGTATVETGSFIDGSTSSN